MPRIGRNTTFMNDGEAVPARVTGIDHEGGVVTLRVNAPRGGYHKGERVVIPLAHTL